MRTITKEELSVGDMTTALLEKQALPIGRTQFMAWSDRIIRSAMVEADETSLRFSLAAMLMHLPTTEAFREDAYFVLSLRKAAVNQTAHAIMQEIKDEQEAKRKTAEDTAPTLRAVEDGVLENQTL